MSDKKPNPGSKEAQEQGCTCPVLDNMEMPEDKKLTQKDDESK